MTREGIDQLTEKEKEALRLLHAGHESKSIARELSLSVHTVNDRLRYARRKLGTSSSRTAARILWEAEGAPHERHVHNPLWVASASGGTQDEQQHNRRHGERSRWWLAAGVLLMTVLIATALALLLGSSDQAADGARPAPAPPAAMSEASASSALPAAREWLALIDRRDWAGSWNAAGDLFRGQISAEQWAGVIEAVREPLGAVTSREFRSVRRTTTLPGAPSGDYEIIEFTTSFANLPAGEETIVMMREPDGWKAAGYFVRT